MSIVESLSRELELHLTKGILIRFLKKQGYTYRRIRKCLRGSPDPDVLAKKTLELAQLLKLEEKKFLKVYFADEAGFNETPSVPYGWQAPQDSLSARSGRGQRLNVFGMMTRNNELHTATTSMSVTSTFVLAQVDKLADDPARDTDVVVVFDNAKIHHAAAFQAKIPEWSEKGVRIFYLPTYSPHLNAIETLWRKMKYEWLLPAHYESWADVKEQINHIIKNFGSKFSIQFSSA